MQRGVSIFKVLCSLRTASFRSSNLQNTCQITRAASFWAETQINDLPDSSVELEVARRHNSSYPFVKNQVVVGTVVKVDRDHVTVDTGHTNKTAFAKKELHLSQLVKSREGSLRNGPRDFRVGDTMHFQLEELETPFGDVGLRVVKPADQDRARLIWAEIEAHRDNHTTLKGRVLNPMNSGYSVGVGGVVGFLPFSLCSLLTASKVGLLQDFLVESADPGKRNLVLSEPQVVAEKAARKKAAKARAAMWEDVKDCSLISGVKEGGAFNALQKESKRDSSLSWFAERPAPPKAMVSREIMWPRVAVLIAHVKNCQQQDRARRKVEDRQKERIFAPRALLDAQELCRNNRALSREDVRTMLAELKKEVRQRIYEEIIGKLNAWGVETDTKLGNSNDVNQGISSCTVA